MDTIRGRHTLNELEEIVNTINNTVNIGDLGESRHCKMLLCYFLWMLQLNDAIVTPDDMDHNGNYRSDVAQFATMSLDDLDAYLYENKDSWNKLLALKGKYTNDELAECINNLDFTDGDYFEIVPDSISELVDELLDIQKGEKVIQLNNQISNFVEKGQAKHPDTVFFTYDREYVSLTNSFIVSDVNNHKDIIFMEHLEDEEKYNKVFANCILDPNRDVYAGELENYINEYWNDFPCKVSGAWSTCGWALTFLEKKGKVVALMNAGQLTVKQTMEARKFICEKGYIEGVIILPDKMYLNTWVNPFLVVLNKKKHKKIKFYDATKKYMSGRVKGKRINVFTEDNISCIASEYEKGINVVEVDLSIIRENDYNLNPFRYITNNDSAKKMIELGSVICDIRRGISITATEMDENISDEPSDVRCIVPSSINDGVITKTYYYHGDIKKPGKNDAHQLSILFSKSGNPFKIAYSSDRYLVVGNLYILDLDRRKINTAYVRCFLNSKQGQDEIRRYAVGPATPIISIENLKKIKIPIFEDEKQEEINRRCEEIVLELDRCYRQISDNVQEINSMFS